MLPQLFLDRMKGLLGEEYEVFVKNLTQESCQALRVNLGKVKGESLPFHLTPVPWAEGGYYYEKEDQPGKHPLHEAGAYYIQEPSAMAPAPLLALQPGERVLDLCAAPGGKSTQLAACLKGRGLLVCNEIHPARARILSENIERMGVKNACVTNEAPETLSKLFPGYFDAILVDAPCSGEGMFRKNEEACAEWSPENVERCAHRQDEILEQAAEMLRSGGRMVYSTCTFAPLENEGSVSRFLKRHPEFSIVPVNQERFCQGAQKATACQGRPQWIENPVSGLEGTLRLWPHHVKGEGHFAALLKKAGELEEGLRPEGRNGLEKGLPERELGEWTAFQREFLKWSFSGKYLKFGDQLYLAPGELPSLKGLKVLRPGLHLGTLKKNRFEPSHALALALLPGEAVHVWNLDAEDPQARAYLSGQTFPASGEKGWYLICVDGCSMGWGKLAGGIMKNHYPKGLRK